MREYGICIPYCTATHLNLNRAIPNGPKIRLNGPKIRLNGPKNHPNGPKNHPNGPKIRPPPSWTMNVACCMVAQRHAY